MATGTPVIASAIPVFRELAGDAAILVDPRDASAIARGVERLFGDGDLRSSLAEKGAARARDFSWGTAAARTLAIYRRALGGP
jgi:glycosyltransferase involved in cell wall biosynthesis